MFLRIFIMYLVVIFNNVLAMTNRNKISLRGKMEGFIVKGEQADIKKYPHAAFLSIWCYTTSTFKNYGCGASIINQVILLTAAHCLEGCLQKSPISIVVGSAKRSIKPTHYAHRFSLHPDYNEQLVANDVALIRTTYPFRFSSFVKKISVMRQPPHVRNAVVSGWGVVDERRKTISIKLKVASQRVMDRQACKDILKRVPFGTICTKSGKKVPGYAAVGDSGGGLVIKEYILIGIVSFKNPEIDNQLVVFTDVAYFYDWIFFTSKKLYCDKP